MNIFGREVMLPVFAEGDITHVSVFSSSNSYRLLVVIDYRGMSLNTKKRNIGIVNPQMDITQKRKELLNLIRIMEAVLEGSLVM